MCAGKRHFGTVVRCKKFIGAVPGMKYKDMWVTDRSFPQIRNPNRLSSYYSDRQLMPLSGTFDDIIAQVTAYKLLGYQHCLELRRNVR